MSPRMIQTPYYHLANICRTADDDGTREVFTVRFVDRFVVDSLKDLWTVDLSFYKERKQGSILIVYIVTLH